MRMLHNDDEISVAYNSRTHFSWPGSALAPVNAAGIGEAWLEARGCPPFPSVCLQATGKEDALLAALLKVSISVQWATEGKGERSFTSRLW